MEDKNADLHAHFKFGQEEPAWTKLSLSVINKANQGHTTLMHGVALALMAAYEAGKAGESPFPKPPVLIKRSRPAPPPPTKILRRKKP